MTATVLIVDDDDTTREFMAPLLRDGGYQVREAATLRAAEEIIDLDEADIIILDVQLPDGYGPDMLERLSREKPNLPIIMVTGYGDIEMAVETMKLGAKDFIAKPIQMPRLRQSVDKAAEIVAMQRELAHWRNSQDKNDDWIVGSSPRMKRLVQDTLRVAPFDTTVMITGENGTGKDVLAAFIGKNSRRAGKPYFPVNCANFKDHLLESELFGYERGAFTGADKRREGLFVTANGGTLFLDEISTMKADLQASFLRVLEDRTIRRVGGNELVKVDVRILAATNRDLKAMTRSGEFREDLYHRLNVVELVMPPLRERLEDIPALVGHFIRKFNIALGRNVQHVGPYVFDALMASAWPGNIRQLRNAIERAMLFADGDVLELGHFAPDIAAALERKPLHRPTPLAV